MSVHVQAYSNGESIGSTDVCAGDSPELKRIFWQLFDEAENCDDRDFSFTCVTRAQVQDVIELLKPHTAPFWQDFLAKLLPYETVTLTAC